jgi:hypothetical protein
MVANQKLFYPIFTNQFPLQQFQMHHHNQFYLNMIFLLKLWPNFFIAHAVNYYRFIFYFIPINSTDFHHIISSMAI